MPKWIRRSDSRPSELARAALELCSERGVQATRVADVAARAGVTVGTVYRYFRDKDALIEAALSHMPRPERRAAVDRPGATLPALADALRRWGEFFRAEGLKPLRAALSDPQRAVVATQGPIADAHSDLAAIIEHGAARGDIRSDLPASDIARSLVGALALDALVPRRDAPSGTHTESLVALATRGLRADGPSWRAGGA
jgi:AcrR family transcriptional regulator